MKTKINILFAVAVFGFIFQSCLKDQADVFDESPSVRMTEYLANAKKVLMKPENGWVMYYYPDNYQSYGGFNFTVKFNEENVEVGYERSKDLNKTVSSLYRLGSDTGPTLSFDTNNAFMHLFATPSSSMYQAYGGDFDFMLLEVEDDHVKMMGRRSGNIIVMKPLQESPASYLAKINTVLNDFADCGLSGLNGNIGGQEVKGSVNQAYQQVELSLGEETKQVAYMFTPEGIRLYEPVEVGSSVADEFQFDPKTMTLTLAGTSESLQGSVPEGFRRYGEYAGEYWLYYNRENEADVKYDSVTVVLSPGVKNSTYLMSGLNANYDIVWDYNRSQGTLSWQIQTLGHLPNGNEVRLCALDGTTGGFTWPTNKVMGSTEWNGDVDKPVYYINAEYLWSGSRWSNSFYLCMWDAEGNRLSAPAASTGWLFPRNATLMRWIYSLAKK